MAKRKPFIRGSRTSAEVIDPTTGQYAGAGYREDYALTGISKGGRRVGPIQLYRRGQRSGKYQHREEPDFAYEDPSSNVGDRMKWGFDRDIRILICIGTIIAVFIICYVVMSMVFDAVGETFVATGLNAADFNNFRIQASLAFGVVVALIVGAGSAMFLFSEEEVDDAIFEA